MYIRSRWGGCRPLEKRTFETRSSAASSSGESKWSFRNRFCNLFSRVLLSLCLHTADIHSAPPGIHVLHMASVACPQTPPGRPAGAAGAASAGVLWKATPDPATGKTYYFNTVTREVSWSPPDDGTYTLTTPKSRASSTTTAPGSAGVAQPSIKPPPAAASSKAASSSASSAASSLGASGTGPQTPLGRAPGAANGALWKATPDPVTGKTYYFNTKTREVSWAKPEGGDRGEGGEGGGGGGDGVGGGAEGAGEGTSKGGGASDAWGLAKDPKTGKEYYFNSQTKQTSWTAPASMIGGGRGRWRGAGAAAQRSVRRCDG